MNELITELADKTGLGREAVEKALGLIIAFLEREDRSQRVTGLIDQMDGARALATAHGARGGIFAMFTALTSAGLGMGEIKTVAVGFLDFARSRFGAEPVDQILKSIPALSQFL